MDQVKGARAYRLPLLILTESQSYCLTLRPPIPPYSKSISNNKNLKIVSIWLTSGKFCKIQKPTGLTRPLPFSASDHTILFSGNFIANIFPKAVQYSELVWLVAIIIISIIVMPFSPSLYLLSFSIPLEFLNPVSHNQLDDNGSAWIRRRGEVEDR